VDSEKRRERDGIVGETIGIESILELALNHCGVCLVSRKRRIGKSIKGRSVEKFTDQEPRLERVWGVQNV
jgi:hypothetical protein